MHHIVRRITRKLYIARLSVLPLLALPLWPTSPAHAEFLTYTPSESGGLTVIHGGPTDAYRLNVGPAVDLGSITDNRMVTTYGVLMFDLRSLSGVHLTSAVLSVTAVITQSNGRSTVGLAVGGYGDGDGAIALAEVQPGAGITSIGWTTGAPANESGIAVAMTVDVAGFLNPLLDAGVMYAGLRLDNIWRDDTIGLGSGDLGPTLLVGFDAVAVPEPASAGLAILGVGLAGMVGHVRRRRRDTWPANPAH